MDLADDAVAELEHHILDALADSARELRVSISQLWHMPAQFSALSRTVGLLQGHVEELSAHLGLTRAWSQPDTQWHHSEAEWQYPATAWNRHTSRWHYSDEQAERAQPETYNVHYDVWYVF